MNALKKLQESQPELATQLQGYIKPVSPYSVYISDKDDKAYDSGLAAWLMDNCKYDNIKTGFIAYLNKK